MVLWLAERLLAGGKHVAILSRGYRGSGGTSDEIEMLKSRLGEQVVFGVGADRYAEGRRIEVEQPVSVFLLDDGFQHLELARDFDIVLIDSSTDLSKEWLLPAGSLREPLSELKRASAVVITRVRPGSDQAEPPAIRKIADVPIFFAETALLGYQRISETAHALAEGDKLPPQPVFAFCGIGNPAAFFDDSKRWGIDVAGHQAFRDHHTYTAHDVRTLETKAQRAGAKALLTTEKDIQNLAGLHFSALPLYCCRISLQIRNEKELCTLLKKKITPRDFLA
jgi:tetraacyldisaccharide 4'-kinase